MKINEAKLKKIAITISVILPVAVAFLFTVKIEGVDLTFLPPIYATINGITALVLIMAYLAIKKRNIKLHQNLINVAVGLSVCFLLMYVLYHATSDSTVFGDTNHDGKLGEEESLSLGGMRFVYLCILISHVLLSIVITPFVYFTYLKGWLGDYEKHKKLTKITFPLWLYIAISGVVVYWMISPYYI